MLKSCASYFFREIDQKQFDFCRSCYFKKERRRILQRNEPKRKNVHIVKCLAKLKANLQKNKALKSKTTSKLTKNIQRIGRKWYLGSCLLLSKNLNRNKKLVAQIENTLAQNGIRDAKYPTSATDGTLIVDLVSNPVANSESSTSASTTTTTKLLVETLTDALKLSEKYFCDVNPSVNRSKIGGRNIINRSVSNCTTLKDMDETQILFLQSIMFPFNPMAIDTTVSCADFLNSTLLLPTCSVDNDGGMAPPLMSDDQNNIYQGKDTNSTTSDGEDEVANQNNDDSPSGGDDDSNETLSFLSFETENVEFVMDINEKVLALLKSTEGK
uniref:Uncharacterized protein n=1 Tax=Romanomermis culicivorax TaxID=13658 RepID=A0A915IUN9_ROMCU